MKEAFYLIDNHLGVRSLASYLSRNGTWWEKGVLQDGLDKGQVVGNTAGPALPISPDGKLQPGALYESSADPHVRFYLPEYRLNVDDGRYTTRLKWRDEHDDPNGPLAYLTLDVVAIIPPAGEFTLQEIPHQAVARIGYQIPVQDDAGGGGRPMLWMDVGSLNPVEGGVRRARLPILDKRDFDRLYQAMTDSNFNSRVEIRCFAVAGRRTWRQVVVSGVDLSAQELALRERKVLYTDLLSEKALELPPAGPGRNTRKVDPGVAIPERIRWHEAIKIMDASPDELAKNEGLSPHISPALIAKLTMISSDAGKTSPDPSTTSPVPATPVETPSRVLPGRIISRMPTTVRTHTEPIILAPASEPIVAQPATVEIRTSPLAKSTVRENVVRPVLARAYARPLPETLADSDIRTKVADKRLKAVPVKAVVGEDGQPAMMQIPVETRQEISPFWFLVETNADMFDIPGDMRPGTHHILIRMEVRDGEGQVQGVFYQDSAYADQFYYQPQEFRLPRANTPPYLPDLRIVFFDLATQDSAGGDNQATLNYRVQLAYKVVPHIDPLLLDLAQQQMPDVQAHFVALSPETTSLSLRVPEDETQGALTDLPRPGVEVRFDQGIVDQIELSRTEFERIFAFFQSPAGVGIDGAVNASLLGNLNTSIPVSLSLKRNTGSVFGHTYLGLVGDGLHRVRLTNLIESPVTIDALYRVTLGGGVFAFPQAAAGQVVQVAGVFDIDYRVSSPTAAVVDIAPSLSVSVNADPRRLWPQLFINSGYTSETFQIHLSVEPDFFGAAPPGGGDPLTGVQVEFDDATTTTLTADTLQTDVRLRIPLLPRLLGDPQAKQYRYRVTNLLGVDAQVGQKSDWTNGEGEAPLVVVPVGA